MRTLIASLLLAVATPALAQTAPVTTAALARKHAPLWKFNAWIPGDSSPMNKTEDYFPQSVARYFEALDRGRVSVVTRESKGSSPREVAERSVRRVSIEKDRIAGVPRGLAGDALGEAPLYYHAYSKGAFTYLEYWVFYPMDKCRVKVLGVTAPVGGHRGDWEGMTIVLDREGKVVRGFFDAHGGKKDCAATEMRFEEGHAVVFVSQGKHAAYPEPGRWKDSHSKAPLEEMDEFFLGDGAAWRSWEGALVDLEGDDEKELAPEAMKKLARFDLRSWVDFEGGWGPDKPVIGVGGSPVGPKQHSGWGSAGAGAKKWSEERLSKGIELLDR